MLPTLISTLQFLSKFVHICKSNAQSQPKGVMIHTLHATIVDNTALKKVCVHVYFHIAETVNIQMLLNSIAVEQLLPMLSLCPPHG